VSRRIIAALASAFRSRTLRFTVGTTQAHRLLEQRVVGERPVNLLPPRLGRSWIQLLAEAIDLLFEHRNTLFQLTGGHDGFQWTKCTLRNRTGLLSSDTGESSTSR
jgi:hypothetical protein